MALVIVGAASLERVEEAVRAFEAEGFTRATQPVASEANREPNRVLGLAGGGAEALIAADARGVKYLLVHVGAPDGQVGGTYERAHHRVEPAKLAELAERVKARDRLLVICLAFGYRHGIPDGSALVIDVRFLDNPYWVPELRPLTGLDASVRDYVLGQPAACRLLDGLQATFEPVLDEFRRRGRTELTIAFGCTGGRHRSVVLAQAMAERLQRGGDIDVEFQARELDA